MPSFDIVSQVDLQEVDNAVNSVAREIKQRYDFKDSDASIDRNGETLTLMADNDQQHKALQEMLKVHMTRRDIDPKSLEFNTAEQASGNKIRQNIMVKQGISQDIAKRITKEIKAEKLKVQAAIRGEEIRVTGKKRDDLQATISMIKTLNIDLPLQYINFRD